MFKKQDLAYSEVNNLKKKCNKQLKVVNPNSGKSIC